MGSKRALAPLCLLAAGAAGISLPAAAQRNAPPVKARHVLLISVDGFHALDLANFIQANPSSTLAQLSRTGITYNNASTPRPSDSFPGTMALITGGLPQTTGIWYDVTYNRSFSAPGSTCAAVGTQVAYDESIDYDNTQLDGGASNHGGQAINPAALPLNPQSGCSPVYPHQYLRVNTVFEVVHAAGQRTAWSDKHPSYEIVNGPSGKGVDDLYNPEIASNVPAGTCNSTSSSPASWTDSVCAIEMYDDFKVQAILHEIDGFDHTGTTRVGVPAIFGMNFQAVSVGEKLGNDYQYGKGGYTDVLGTPTVTLANALSFVDSEVGKMVAELKKQNLSESTVIIVTAKHGQSPIDPNKVQRINPSLIQQTVGSAYAFDMSDDGSLIWLNDQSQTGSVVANLSTSANENLLGIQEIYSGNSLSLLFDSPQQDSRTPDIILKTNTGVIFTTGSKVAEHGGFNDDDQHIALLISNPGIPQQVQTAPVQTKQVAPSVLQMLGLNPNQLQAVQVESTPVLPNLFPSQGE